MKYVHLVFLWQIVSTLFLLPNSAVAQSEIPLIPKPNQITVANGTYVIPNITDVHVSEEFAGTADIFAQLPGVDSVNVVRIRNVKRIPEQGIRIIKAHAAHPVAPGAYRLKVDSTGIQLVGHDEHAIVSGFMTLLQLSYLQDFYNVIPRVTIEDKPAYGYRGLHLDVSRHFFPVSFLKKYIDLMAMYKYNHFHWHLTDDGGWRLHIREYPELTQQAAWRTHDAWTDWKANGRRYVQAGHPNAHGGYYTQQEVRELVEYAQGKGITIVPEIDMPGHADAVLAVHPELGCTGHAYHHAEFCVGNEQTSTFLTKVLDEVIELFPSPYIHIGGDEVDKASWKTCSKCQALKDSLGLEDEAQLQSHFIKRIDAHLKSKGRKLIGWDEIMEGGLPEGATVMSWRGQDHGVEAANAGHNVIMTPQSHLYFDYYQSDPRTQPQAIGGFTTLDQVYAYNPRAGVAGDKAQHVLGAQGNVWTEYMPTQTQVEYMAFPRAIALSEVLWTNADKKDFEDFRTRLQAHYRLLQRLNVNYYRPSFNAQVNVQYNPKAHNNTVSIVSEQYEPSIRYTVDGTNPTATSPLYSKSFDLAASTVVKAAYFMDSVQVGRIDSAVVDLHKAIGKKVTYHTPWDTYAAQSEATLTNGQKGGLRYGDGQWQGFLGDFDVVIDFERREQISQVAIRFLQDAGPGIFLPERVKILLSDNGTNFREVATIRHQVSPDDTQLTFYRFEETFEKPVAARYLRITAPRARPGFLFADEVVVY